MDQVGQHLQEGQIALEGGTAWLQTGLMNLPGILRTHGGSKRRERGGIELTPGRPDLFGLPACWRDVHLEPVHDLPRSGQLFKHGTVYLIPEFFWRLILEPAPCTVEYCFIDSRLLFRRVVGTPVPPALHQLVKAMAQARAAAAAGRTSRTLQKMVS